MVPLIDAFGETQAAAIGGAGLGLLFGFFAQRSAFCTRSAVLDVTRGRDLKALAVWSAGFAAAILGVQFLLYGGWLSVVDTRFFGTPQSLSGALAGGLVFGTGMALTRGCVSRLLVLGASGNLRALFCILVTGLVGWATYDGILVPLRDRLSSLARTGLIGGNDLLALGGLNQRAGVAIGCVLAIVALAVTLKARPTLWRVAGGVGVGLTVVGGWYFTYQLSTQVFEPIQAESLSFIRPLATSASLATDAAPAFGLDQGLLAGTLVGAFLAAILFREFRIVTFTEPGAPSILRYAAGSALMGFGGILAVGCTIGAGFTGGSVLAVTSLVALAAMIAGAALADRLVDGRVNKGATVGGAAVPAE
ncbi:MAG: YeeE/YedE family protein [Hyphomicrobiales bacterium]|nr:YeeE/YedE family protein [Hyphomicrobiales bacterium]